MWKELRVFHFSSMDAFPPHHAKAVAVVEYFRGHDGAPLVEVHGGVVPALRLPRQDGAPVGHFDGAGAGCADAARTHRVCGASGYRKI